tara:strand:- start:158 stop:430 length:273 start_codon:yes stop_codon:yes gene_type:complete
MFNGVDMRILFENCDVDKAEDRTLPNNAFVVEYKVEDVSQYDIALAAKQSEIFDYYYDKFKKDFVTMRQTEGRANPKLWGIKAPETKKKR